LNFYNFGDCAVYLIQTKLETQWAEHASLTCWTNQKQELPMVAMFVNGLKRNEQSLERTFHRYLFLKTNNLIILGFTNLTRIKKIFKENLYFQQKEGYIFLA
jgi:hypothetical protein